MSRYKQDQSVAGNVSFLLMVIFSLLIAAALIVMMVIFARNPSFAPPGICKWIALIVPVILMALLMLGIFQRVAEIRKGE